MIQELIGRVFAARDIAHRAHWRTTSFAVHEALNAFYNALPELIDSIVETHQGLLGLVDPEIVLAEDPKDLLVWMKSEADWIEANRVIGFQLTNFPEFSFGNGHRTDKATQARTIFGKNYGEITGKVNRTNGIFTVMYIGWMQTCYTAIFTCPAWCWP